MNVWYTKGLSVTAQAMRLVRDGFGSSAFLIASHDNPAAPVQMAADHFLVEPEESDGYPEWVLENAQEMDVDLVIAQRFPEAMWAYRDAFESAGIRLHLPAGPDALRVLCRKDLFCMDLEGLGLPVAAFEVFRSGPEFDDAMSIMKGDGLAPDGFCVKPVEGIYGSGFRILKEEGSDLDRLLRNSFFEMSTRSFRRLLPDVPAGEDMMLMRFLPGVERSVDFLSRDGEMLAGAARVKQGSTQHIEMEGEALELARTLAREYGLNGICNMQTREDADGQQFILEVNPRMSGGLPMTSLCGLNLPAWDVALALDLRPAGEIPQLPGGQTVCMEASPILLPSSSGGPC